MNIPKTADFLDIAEELEKLSKMVHGSGEKVLIQHAARLRKLAQPIDSMYTVFCLSMDIRADQRVLTRFLDRLLENRGADDADEDAHMVGITKVEPGFTYEEQADWGAK